MALWVAVVADEGVGGLRRRGDGEQANSKMDLGPGCTLHEPVYFAVGGRMRVSSAAADTTRTAGMKRSVRPVGPCTRMFIRLAAYLGHSGGHSRWPRVRLIA